ncbi:hypothetical protein DL89DRAFT_269553 [Linderina pennispora]|uniref:Uncharacterized protein n=1 Tax=Linderina pennispora TaxID=61395 RepID=A0A1Y1W1M1_9FUNG|nr:uncharacterized protein DL89DRAFT_269553 [Linderina pennispora]ORX67126.1 hypothetical protein DL89DRAFT_269553 [Linderina pennispora]
MRYGDFRSLCERSPLPVCRVFIRGDDRKFVLDNLDICSLKETIIGGSTKMLNIPDFAISIVAFLATVYLGFKAHRKLAAVGRREMSLLLSLFCILLVANLVGSDLWFKSTRVSKWLGIANTALEVSFFWALILVGLVGFQILPDGSFASILSIVVTTIIVFVGIGYIAADTAFGISDGLKPKDSDPFYSPALFTVYLVFPLVSIVIYLASQIVVVVKYLAVRGPLAWLLVSVACFALAQALMFAVSRKICTGTNKKIDGAFFATLLDSAAVFCIYGFWAAITEDDSEDYAGMYKF